MKALVIGLGSIGKRVTKLLLNEFKFEVFALRRSLKEVNEFEKNILFSQGIDFGVVDLFKPDMAFICNPTDLHIETALECVKREIPIFIEKPIDVSNHKLDELISLCHKKRISTYVAYLLRFHPCIKFLKSNVEIKDIRFVNSFCESYLPSWRKTNHLKSYSSFKDQGGGVILDLSHEFDYIEYLFGPMTKLDGEFGRKSSVTIDSEDFLDAKIECGNIKVELTLNYFSRESRRGMEINLSNNKKIKVDLMAGSVFFDNELVFKEDVNIDLIYLEQLNYFIENLDNVFMMNNINDASGLFKKLIAFKNGD